MLARPQRLKALRNRARSTARPTYANHFLHHLAQSVRKANGHNARISRNDCVPSKVARGKYKKLVAPPRQRIMRACSCVHPVVKLMNSSYTLLDVIQVVFRHKAKCIFAAALTMTLAVLAIRFWPRSYQSETKLLVKLGRESVTLDPTANTGKLVSNVEGSRESEVNAAVEVLGSRALIDQVVQKIGVGRLAQAGADTDAPQWLSQAAESTKGFVKQASSALLGKDREVSEHEKCVTKLHKKIKCETTAQQSNVITTIALAKTPEMAQEVLTTLVDCFLDEHIRINRVEGSMEFFAKQTKSLEKETKPSP